MSICAASKLKFNLVSIIDESPQICKIEELWFFQTYTSNLVECLIGFNLKGVFTLTNYGSDYMLFTTERDPTAKNVHVNSYVIKKFHDSFVLQDNSGKEIARKQDLVSLIKNGAKAFIPLSFLDKMRKEGVVLTKEQFYKKLDEVEELILLLKTSSLNELTYSLDTFALCHSDSHDELALHFYEERNCRQGSFFRKDKVLLTADKFDECFIPQIRPVDNRNKTAESKKIPRTLGEVPFNFIENPKVLPLSSLLNKLKECAQVEEARAEKNLWIVKEKEGISWQEANRKLKGSAEGTFLVYEEQNKMDGKRSFRIAIQSLSRDQKKGYFYHYNWKHSTDNMLHLFSLTVELFSKRPVFLPLAIMQSYVRRGFALDGSQSGQWGPRFSEVEDLVKDVKSPYPLLLIGPDASSKLERLICYYIIKNGELISIGRVQAGYCSSSREFRIFWPKSFRLGDYVGFACYRVYNQKFQELQSCKMEMGEWIQQIYELNRSFKNMTGHSFFPSLLRVLMKVDTEEAWQNIRLETAYESLKKSLPEKEKKVLVKAFVLNQFQKDKLYEIEELSKAICQLFLQTTISKDQLLLGLKLPREASAEEISSQIDRFIKGFTEYLSLLNAGTVASIGIIDTVNMLTELKSIEIKKKNSRS